MSPELALVDPDLAAWARSLPEPSTVQVVSPKAPAVPNVTPAAATRARSRLMEGALADDAFALIEPPRRLRRRVSLVTTSSAAAAVAMLVAQLVLARGRA
jgi:hypothetical protein